MLPARTAGFDDHSASAGMPGPQTSGQHRGVNRGAHLFQQLNTGVRPTGGSPAKPRPTGQPGDPLHRWGPPTICYRCADSRRAATQGDPDGIRWSFGHGSDSVVSWAVSVARLVSSTSSVYPRATGDTLGHGSALGRHAGGIGPPWNLAHPEGRHRDGVWVCPAGRDRSLSGP